jgi:hypothetical protein
MNEATNKALDLIYGRWRSQILYAGTELGIFDHVALEVTKTSDAVAAELDLDPALLYRLMRALASLGLLTENESRGFSASEVGDLFRSDHPRSLRYQILITEGPEHYAIWKHLADMIRDGKQDAFSREFGAPAFEYARKNSRYRRDFDLGMTAISVVHTRMVLDALREFDFSGIRTICDVGGGHGRLICAFLTGHPHLTGSVLDLPEVFDDRTKLWGTKLGLENRCAYVVGDMFKQVPLADAYSLQRILHDWSDPDCVQILSIIREAAPKNGRVFIIEHVVPGPTEPHFSKLYDIQMMCWGTGRERTEDEYAGLLHAAGWRHFGSWYPSERTIGIIEGGAV